MPNHLADETSPYLLQHADQPVDWYAWGEAALQKARDENKPILLSIGYSACHWCHVMAHESFADAAIAERMNAHFVNIKVDREERPDLDKIYQRAHQLLTRQPGGWPLTMFLTPDDHVPFFGGTYFPPTPRFGRPGFDELLARVAAFHATEKDAITEHNRALVAHLERSNRHPVVDPSTVLDAAPLHAAITEMSESFDRSFGGFGDAPKFPQAPSLELLLGYPGDPASEMLTRSLDGMALGGLYDQIGGGFFRYSVDRRWAIPHFEKMLYDNGLLLTLYARSFQVTQTPAYRQVAEGIAAWLIDEMQTASGGYAASLDADSEGEEGKFYLWSSEEIGALLSPEEYAALSRHYALEGRANFEGRWHFNVAAQPKDANEARLLAAAKRKLKAHRDLRLRPGCDDKILASWNALAIKGMATAALIFDNDDYLASAEKALACLRQHLYRDGKLYASYRNGTARLNAYLDDYAFLIDALLTLLQCRYEEDWLRMATELADTLLRSFADNAGGGFFFTADDHEPLLERSKSFTDDALPSGNGVAARVLRQLGCLLNDLRYTDAAQATLRAAWQHLNHYPLAHAGLLLALGETCAPPRQVVITGGGKAMDDWRAGYRHHHAPFDTLLVIPPAARLPDALSHYRADDSCDDGAPVAYLCEGTTCHAPISDLALFIEKLDNSKSCLTLGRE